MATQSTHTHTHTQREREREKGIISVLMPSHAHSCLHALCDNFSHGKSQKQANDLTCVSPHPARMCSLQALVTGA
jgi:hypothetical protein